MIERGKIRREVKPLTREIKTENKKTRLITDRPGFDFLKSAFFQRILSLLNRSPVEVFLADVKSSRTNQSVVVVLLDIVCGPA